MEQEIWKDIPWYEWLYKVSSFWRIKSLVYRAWKWFINREKILSPWINDYWYLVVTLHKNWKRSYLVNRLVWQLFLWLEINNTSLLVCHKDDIRTNNNVNNLFIWTAKDNIQDCIKKRRFRWWDSQKKIVIQFWMDWELIKEWEYMSLASRELSIPKSDISHCCNWYRKSAWWYIWKYNK